jgi:hypothetical protein
MITEDDFIQSLNKQNFYLSIIEAISSNLCKDGKRFLKHICNGYFFNCYSKNDIHNIKVFSNPKKQKEELEAKERHLEQIFYHIEVFKTKIIPRFCYEISYSKCYTSQISNLTKEERSAIEEICRSLQTGESVKDFYSNSVFNAFANKDAVEYDAKNKKEKIISEDKLLNAFNIKHLHLTKGKKKGDKILLFIQNNNEIYLIGFFDHEIFKGKGLSGEGLKKIIEIIESDFPQYLQSILLKNVNGDLELDNQGCIATTINSGCIPILNTKFGALPLGNCKQIINSIRIKDNVETIINNIYQTLKKEIQALCPYKYLIQNDGIYIVWNFKNKSQNKVELKFTDLTPITFLKNLCYISY